MVAMLSPLATLAGPMILQSPDRQTHLLELYTSEGCSSCPPADRWLSDLKADPRLWREVVPVAFHVDYWDSLGWPDRFAAAAYSDRQRIYAAQGLTRTVYTPGFFLNGSEWRQWFNRRSLALDTLPRVGTLKLKLQDGHIDAELAPVERLSEPLKLEVALLGFELATQVEAGENRGRRLRHDFVVLGYQRVAMTGHHDGRFIAHIELPRARVTAPRLALAAWVSGRRDLRPLQAVGGWLDADQIP
jgi:hypothetical protein